MKNNSTNADADMSGAGAALERAALRARRLSEQTGKPLSVCRDGKVLDLNPQSRPGTELRKEKPVA